MVHFLLLLLAIGVVLFLLHLLLHTLAVPLVFRDKIQEYRNGQMPRKEIRQWRVVFVLFGIIAVLLTFIFLGISKG